MEHLAGRLAALPGVVAVTLGGSRAQGRARPGSDWDLGLYDRGTIDPGDVRALGFEGRVSAPWAWGSIVDGGAWLRVEGERVDLIYRDLDEVLRWTAEAEAGRFEVRREVGYVAGIATYVLAERGEWALNEKGLLERAGLAQVGDLLGAPGSHLAELVGATSDLLGLAPASLP